MEEKLKKRFMNVAIAVYDDLRVIGFPHPASEAKRQLIRSSASSAANYRAACRAKSSADFLNKLKSVEEELDESLFWIEFLAGISDPLKNSDKISVEVNELLSIIVSSIKTTRSRLRKTPKS